MTPDEGSELPKDAVPQAAIPEEPEGIFAAVWMRIRGRWQRWSLRAKVLFVFGLAVSFGVAALNASTTTWYARFGQIQVGGLLAGVLGALAFFLFVFIVIMIADFMLAALKTWPHPRKSLLVVFFCNITIFVGAILLPTSSHAMHFSSIYGAGSELLLLKPLVWLFAANLISIFSVYIINWETGGLSGQFKPNYNLRNYENYRRKLYNLLKLMRIISSFVFAPLLVLAILSIVVYLLPLFVDTLNDDYKQYARVYVWVLFFLTGPVYLSVMLVNDLIACGCQRVVDSWRAEEKYHYLQRGVREQVENLASELSVYPWIVWIVDLPILFGLAMIFWEKSYYSHFDMYYMGFATGAVAMHVIAANIISTILEYVVKGRALLERTTA